MRAGGRTGRHDEAKSLFRNFANTPKNIRLVIYYMVLELTQIFWYICSRILATELKRCNKKHWADSGVKKECTYTEAWFKPFLPLSF
jgi:hypothetical protein